MYTYMTTYINTYISNLFFLNLKACFHIIYINIINTVIIITLYYNLYIFILKPFIQK